jgi:hypothetical protein
MVRREEPVSSIEDKLSKLETLVGQVEARLRALQRENATLRAAMERSAAAGGPASATAREGPDRTVRLIALEAEREEIRGRLHSLLDNF